MHGLRILVVEDRESTRRMLEETLGDAGYRVSGIGDGTAAVEVIAGEGFDLVITDLQLPGKDGIEVLAAARENDPLAPVIVMTAHGTVECAVSAMKRGAYDFLTKPVDTDRLLLLVERALERRALEIRNCALAESTRPRTMVGKSRALREVLDLVEKVARSDTAVLLLGESGTGKELVARQIHSTSLRAANPLVAINCAALPAGLVESELFGAEKGAYTGADTLRRGKFELAQGGTLFFDEIGELDVSLQSKFLRVLEEKEITRVGGSRSIPVNARVIAATNRDIAEEVRKGRFREDLFYRLNVFPIHLPPLRERMEDVPPIAARLLEGIAREMRLTTLRLTADAVARLISYDWPGNVRELKNTLERAAILAGDGEITPSLLAVGEGPRGVDRDATDLHAAVRAATRKTEIDLISRVLAECAGNKSEAARRMKVSYRSLWSKIKEYELQ